MEEGTGSTRGRAAIGGFRMFDARLHIARLGERRSVNGRLSAGGNADPGPDCEPARGTARGPRNVLFALWPYGVLWV
jgi:hypothetical protein